MSLQGASKASRRAVSRTAALCILVLVVMVGAAFAAVPLYRLFCQQTGYDGAGRRAKAAPAAILDKRVTIRFDANVRDLPWDFAPDQLSQNVRIGDTGLAFYHVTNRSDQPITAHASYNVVPLGAGLYFEKLQCFCFTDQTLMPGQSVDFPVVYFVDPRFATDPDTKNAKEITLSYTFYRVNKPASAPRASAAPGASNANKASQPIGGSPRAAL